MENQAVTLEDVHHIVKYMLNDPEIVENKRRLYNAMGLPAGEFPDLERKAQFSGSESYEFFSSTIIKWIRLKGNSATFQQLILTLREENFNSVAEKIESKLFEPSDTTTTVTSLKFVWFEVPEEIQYFAGRHAELIALHHSITNSNNQNITVLTVVTGLGGVGKTSLAVKYAWKYQTFFQNVIWINAENRDSMRESFHRLAEHLKFENYFLNDPNVQWYKSISAVYKFFQDKTSLFIFDNAESEIEISSPFLPSPATPFGKKPFILLTSRNADWSEKFNVIQLQAFTKKESMEFLVNYLALEGKTEIELAMKLLKSLNGLPIAIRQAAAYIKSERQQTEECIEMCIRIYLEDFFANCKSFLSYEYWLKTGDMFRQSTFVTWNITFQKIKENKLATRIIRLISFWGPDYIPVKVFNFLQANGLANKIIRLFSRNSSHYENAKEVRTAISILVQYSMLILTENQGLNIHRIVQTVIRENMSERLKRKIVRENINLVKTFLEVGSMSTTQNKSILFLHAETILAQAKFLVTEKEYQEFFIYLLQASPTMRSLRSTNFRLTESK